MDSLIDCSQLNWLLQVSCLVEISKCRNLIGEQVLVLKNHMHEHYAIFVWLRNTVLDPFFHGDTVRCLTNHKMNSRWYPTHWPLIFCQQLNLPPKQNNQWSADCSGKFCCNLCLWCLILSQSKAECQDVFTCCYSWTTECQDVCTCCCSWTTWTNQQRDYCWHLSVRLFWWLHTYFRCSSCC